MAEKKSAVTELMEEGKRKGKLTAKESTDLYKNFDVQVYYSRLLDLRGE